MTQPTLLDVAERHTADTSLIALEKLQPLPARDLHWLREVYRYLEFTGFADVTGWELARWAGVPVTTTRPRLTGCLQRGWLEKGPRRPSRATLEGVCHGLRPTLPRAAVERAHKALTGA